MRRLVVLVLLGSIAFAGVAMPAGAGSSPIGDIQVTGAVGETPTVEFSTPFSTKKTLDREIISGTGEKLVKGDKVEIHYIAFDARTGELVESSFDGEPVPLTLDKASQPFLVKGLTGSRVGSRVLIALAPKEGIASGLESLGVKKNDTLLFVADVVSTSVQRKRATGTEVAPVDGLPTVKLSKKGTPTITIPKTEAPSALVVQPLIVGDGPVVEAGQTIKAHYTGLVYKDGKQFDSSWKRGEPANFPIGVGQVIPGWDEGLVGQTVGSQVLLVIPPDKGYGADGNPQAGIAGTDTLVFVVDILDAVQKAPAVHHGRSRL